jgi:hypothetical protein
MRQLGQQQQPMSAPRSGDTPAVTQQGNGAQQLGTWQGDAGQPLGAWQGNAGQQLGAWQGNGVPQQQPQQPQRIIINHGPFKQQTIQPGATPEQRQANQLSDMEYMADRAYPTLVDERGVPHANPIFGQLQDLREAPMRQALMQAQAQHLAAQTQKLLNPLGDLPETPVGLSVLDSALQANGAIRAAGGLQGAGVPADNPAALGRYIMNAHPEMMPALAKDSAFGDLMKVMPSSRDDWSPELIQSARAILAQHPDWAAQYAQQPVKSWGIFTDPQAIYQQQMAEWQMYQDLIHQNQPR